LQRPEAGADEAVGSRLQTFVTRLYNDLVTFNP
jgi:hypothetical protein